LLEKYSNDFSKVSKIAEANNLRMSALYDNMQRILERYFDFKKK
jgi:predicted DNA-binding protein YlxM (UPF0122 family)